MATLIYGDELMNRPKLARQMFQDRAFQFGTRLNWSVSVDKNGCERDQFDQLNPLYLIDTDSDENHLGSMRLLPCSGPTMISEVFPQLQGDAVRNTPLLWECTRFCLGRTAKDGAAGRLLGLGALVLKQFGLDGYIAIYDRRMERVYRKYNVSPKRLAEVTDDHGNYIRSGVWVYDEESFCSLVSSAKLSQDQVDVFEGSAKQKSRRWMERISPSEATSRVA